MPYFPCLVKRHQMEYRIEMTPNATIIRGTSETSGNTDNNNNTILNNPLLVSAERNNINTNTTLNN